MSVRQPHIVRQHDVESASPCEVMQVLGLLVFPVLTDCSDDLQRLRVPEREHHGCSRDADELVLTLQIASRTELDSHSGGSGHEALVATFSIRRVYLVLEIALDPLDHWGGQPKLFTHQRAPTIRPTEHEHQNGEHLGGNGNFRTGEDRPQAIGGLLFCQFSGRVTWAKFSRVVTRTLCRLREQPRQFGVKTMREGNGAAMRDHLVGGTPGSVARWHPCSGKDFPDLIVRRSRQKAETRVIDGTGRLVP